MSIKIPQTINIIDQIGITCLYVTIKLHIPRIIMKIPDIILNIGEGTNILFVMLYTFSTISVSNVDKVLRVPVTPKIY